MKYKTPELTALMPAIEAVQSTTSLTKSAPTPPVDIFDHEGVAAYADWE